MCFICIEEPYLATHSFRLPLTVSFNLITFVFIQFVIAQRAHNKKRKKKTNFVLFDCCLLLFQFDMTNEHQAEQSSTVVDLASIILLLFFIQSQ